MPYIGKQPEHGRFAKVDQINSGFDGSAVTFNLTVDSVAVYPTNPQNLVISIGGVIQQPGTDYTVSAATLTLTSAPAASTDFFGVLLGDVLDIGTPSDGSVTVSKMAANSVDSDQYVDASIDLVHMSANSVDSNQYVDGSIETVHIDALQITGAKIAANTITGDKIALGSDAQGDVMYYNGTDWVRLGFGTSGHFLKTQGTGANPVWAAATSTFIGVRVENSSHQSINNNSSIPIVFDASVTQFDTDTMHVSGNSSRITFTTAGKYFVAISYAWAGATGGRRNVSCRKNGSGQIHRQTISPNTNDELHNGYSFIYEFSATDYVEFIAHQTSGSALLMMADNESSTVAMAYKID